MGRKWERGKEFFDADNAKAQSDLALWFEERISELPHADVAEVVRCKDCKYWEQHEKLKSIGTCKCPRYDYVIETDDPYDGAWLEPEHNFWCGYGERKEKEHE